MRKEVFLLLSIFLLAATSATAEEPIDAGLVPGDLFYGIDTSLDALRLLMASDKEEPLVASEINQERLAEAYVLAEEGEETEEILEVIAEAEEKSKIIQENINPETQEEIQIHAEENIQILTALKEIVPDEARLALEAAIERRIFAEEKTKIIAKITASIDGLCRELIQLVGLDQAIVEEPRCNPAQSNTPKWLKEKAEGEYRKFDESARKKFMKEMKICQNNPRECRCEEIPIESFREKCEVIIPEYIKCKEAQNEEACRKVEMLSKDEQMMDDLPEDIKREMMEEHMPPPCREAGATDWQSCERIMREKYLPEECRVAGATTEESCHAIMMARHIPKECKEQGATTEEECREMMMKKHMPPLCKEQGITDKEECRRVMMQHNLPEACQGVGAPATEACKEALRNRQEERHEFKEEFKEDRESALRYCQEKTGKSREECDRHIQQKFEERQYEEKEDHYRNQCEGLSEEQCREKMNYYPMPQPEPTPYPEPMPPTEMQYPAHESYKPYPEPYPADTGTASTTERQYGEYYTEAKEPNTISGFSVRRFLEELPLREWARK
ncbi:MAG: DUF5667 domain-containing protein [Nanoarchaeota archaeon]